MDELNKELEFFDVQISRVRMQANLISRTFEGLMNQVTKLEEDFEQLRKMIDVGKNA